MTDAMPVVGVGEWRREGGLVWWEASLGAARLVFTTRLGGAAAPPYDSLNLGFHVGDAPAAVRENRARLWATVAPAPPRSGRVPAPAATKTGEPRLGREADSGGGRAPGDGERAAAPPVVAEQVHGVAPSIVGAADAGRGWQSRKTAVPETDALVTREADVALAILVADCAPVAVVSPGGALALVHAGWRGLVHGVLEATLARLADVDGGPPERNMALVGPCIRGCCYEVGEEVWRRFPESCLAPAGRPDARRLDLMAAVVHRLTRAGLPASQIHTLGLCTACHPDLFFSHRRATQERLPSTGRMALLGWLREP